MDRTAHSHAFNQFSQQDTLFDSHYTRVSQSFDHRDNWFSEQRDYSRSILAGWGLPLGDLPYNSDNEQTLRAVVELIGFRQKDIQFRSKVKEDIAAITFEKQKYRSFMEQSQRSLEECIRKLGRVENESSELKMKTKKGEVAAKKQKDEDKKMINMLRAKNEQILHQIKKKEQQVNRVKEQMKKSVGEKSHPHSKNSFEVFEALPSKKETSKAQQAKYVYLLERNERQMSQLLQQNNMLREKLFELREGLLDFNEWVDRQLFGEVDLNKYKRQTRFPLNHNLLFKKDSLVSEFHQLLQVAKDGITQLRDFHRSGGTPSQKKTKSTQFLPSLKQENQFELNFKKKTNKTSVIKTDREKPSLNKNDGLQQTPQKKKEDLCQGKISPRSHKVIKSPRSFQRANTFKTFKQIETKQGDKVGRRGSVVVEHSEVHLPFQDQLLSDVMEVPYQDSSIVSHIEVDKLGKNKFDKWDILYQDDE